MPNPATPDPTTLRDTIAELMGYTGPRRTLAYIDRLVAQEYHDGAWRNIPDWPNDLTAAFTLLEQWCKAAPENGVHEIHMNYEDFDGMRVPGWYCFLSRFTDKEEQFAVYGREEPLDDLRMAICLAWVEWQECK